MPTLRELIRRSWELYRRHFGLFAGYAAYLLLPYAALVLLHLPGDPEKVAFFSSLLLIIQAGLALWVSVLIPLACVELVRGTKKLPIGELQTRAWQLLPSVVFVSLIENAVVLGGTVMLVIPGLIFFVWFGLSTFSVMIDGTRGLDALVSTRELVRGRFGTVAKLLIGGPILLTFLAILIIEFFISVFAEIGDVPFEVLVSTNPPLWADVISTVGQVFFIPLLMIYLTLLALALRATPVPGRKESV